MTFKYILSFVIAYLLGSISTSILVSKVMIHDDIRNYGSKNAGATNTLRTVGKLGALYVVIGDILKTVLAVIFARLISENAPIATYIAAIGAVLGHNFPIFFGFRGGKGIIVSVVAMFFADPILAALVTVISITIMAISKYVSLGSIIGAVLFLVLSIVKHWGDLPFIVFAAILSLLAIYRHKTNIKRLISGTENKISLKKKN